MTEELKPCPFCSGRGYHYCACHPGDCLCGEDYRDCEECDGTGWMDPDFADFYEDDPTLSDPPCPPQVPQPRE